MEHYPHNTAGYSGFAVTPSDLVNYRTQRYVLDRPFINVAPTMPGYDHLWASYSPYKSSAGFNRGYVSTGTVLRDGTMSHVRDREIIHETPPVSHSYGLGYVGIDRPEGVSESTYLRDGFTHVRGINAAEKPLPDFAPEFNKFKPLPDLSLMAPYEAPQIIFPGTRGGISTRNIGRYHKTPFSIKYGEYMH